MNPALASPNPAPLSPDAVMLVWFLKLIGVDKTPGGGDLITHIDEAQFVFARPTLFWVGLVIAAALGVLILWRQWVTVPPGRVFLPLALTGTRLTVLMLLVFVLGGPYLKLDHKSDKQAVVALLFDTSKSALLPAGPFDPSGETTRLAQAAGYKAVDGTVDSTTLRALNQMSRAKLAQAVVATSGPSFLEAVAGKYDVQAWAFDREPRNLGVDPKKPEIPEPAAPGGPATHIGDAVAKVLDEAGGRPVAGIFVFTDGQNNGGLSLAEAASRCAAYPAPLFAVPVGASARLRDLAVVDAYAPGQVAVGDTVKVAATVESTGFDKTPIKVELVEAGKVVDTKELILRGAEQQAVELSFTAKEAGARALEVRVPVLPGESDELKKNNTDTLVVRVTEDRLKVLFVEGGPRWDFRFLKNAMRRDNGLAGRAGTTDKPSPVDIVLETEWRRLAPADREKALPRTLDELSQYHTVILGDMLPPDEKVPPLLTTAFIDLLQQAVREKGVGVIVEAGPLSMPHRFPSLAALLPVVLTERRAGLLPTGKPFRMELAPDGAAHEAMRLYDEAGRNSSAWAQMQPYGWCIAAERPAPGATVLASNPSVANDYGKLPLIAYHQAGAGRVMLVGTDSTWLWRANVGDRFFYKFWGQAIRLVARRDEAGKKKSWIEARPARAQPGETGQIEVMAFDAAGAPVAEKSVTVRVTGPGTASAVQLVADPLTRGRFTGKFVVPTAGDFEVAYAAADAPEPIKARIRARDASEELRFPNVNRDALTAFAASAGGKLVELTVIGDTVPTLKAEKRAVSFKREAPLWDNWLILAVLIFVYSLDVGLRRLTGLS